MEDLSQKYRDDVNSYRFLSSDAESFFGALLFCYKLMTNYFYNFNNIDVLSGHKRLFKIYNQDKMKQVQNNLFTKNAWNYSF